MPFSHHAIRCAVAALAVALFSTMQDRPASASDGREIAVSRDPFVPLLHRRSEAGVGIPGAPFDGLPNLVLPPNAAAGPPPFGSTYQALPAVDTVKAIVLGERARALIVSGSQMRIVGVGDRLDGAVVTRIAATSVHLSSGATLVLDETRR